VLGLPEIQQAPNVLPPRRFSYYWGWGSVAIAALQPRLEVVQRHDSAESDGSREFLTQTGFNPVADLLI
jgi:hypothetical protein